MAFRVASKRLTASRTILTTPARYASTAAATQTFNLPPHLQAEILRDASLPTPDPQADSQSHRLVSSMSQYAVPTYVKPSPVFVKGEGCKLYDMENREYLDFTAGIAVNALGHCDPGVTHILASQSSTLLHCSNLYHNPWAGELGKILVEKTKESGAMKDAAKIFIANSGSEANEAAIKFARKSGRTLDPSGRKHKILSFQGSFHGRTMGSLSATPNPKYQTPFSPMIPGFDYGTVNDMASINDMITDETCGVMIEPIQGEGGVNVASNEFLQALRKRCDETGALLIFDEIQCGLGRTGDLWAHAASGVHPDVLTTAKALGNGYPVGATVVTDEVSSRIVTGDHGTTFGGNPAACRVAHYMLSRLSDPSLLQEVARKGEIFRAHFSKLQEEFGSEVVKEVRGRGLMLGVQLSGHTGQVITAARERGLLVISCGVETLRFVPPLTIEEEEIERGMSILREAMRVVFEADDRVGSTKGQQEMGDKR